MNTCVSRIARRQAHFGGFVLPPSPSFEASEDNDDDDDSDNDEDKDASSPSDDEMSTGYTYSLSLVTKKGSSFEIRVVILIGRRLV